MTALVALTGCSGDDSPSDAVSKAASAARSVGGEASAAASSLAAQASEAYASATAAAGREFDEVKGGVDAKDDVRVGTPATERDGRTTVVVTVDNTAGSAKSFLVQVDFTDRSGKRVDVVLVTVSGLAAGDSGQATARSTHDLGGEVTAKVARAVRY